jgi:hypothetical protein
MVRHFQLLDQPRITAHKEQVTPKALANSSPGLERSDNPGERSLNKNETLKGFALRQTLNRVQYEFD